jgi:cyclophilin family peptidyl-prolyl cis-trans isomerase/HEAT repeat protein
MRPMTCAVIGLAIAASPVSSVAQVASRITRPADKALLTALVAIEDSRDTVVLGNDVRRQGMSSANPYIRAFAIRGLGRLEKRSMVPIIAPTLDDPSPDVRAAGADALAQSVFGGGEADARPLLIGRLSAEREPSVRAMLLESIGRLRQGSSDQAKATALVIAPAVSDASPITRHGAIRGLFFLTRRREARGAGVVPAEITDRLYALLTASGSTFAAPEDRARIAWILSGTATLVGDRVRALVTDRDPSVRERAVADAARAGAVEATTRIVAVGRADPAPFVRYRSVIVYSDQLRARDGCAPLIEMAHDRDLTVALAAIDALSGCATDRILLPSAIALVDSLARGDVTGEQWHLPAHAVVSLALLDRARAARQLARFATADNFFVRMYADSVARILSDTATLYRLAGDAHPNVRSSAIAGLSALVGHAADSVYVSALASDDNQLLMRATAALKGAVGDTAVLRAVEKAWRRLHDARPARETSTDGLKALADRYVELGGRLTDIGSSPTSVTAPRMPTPTFDELAPMEKLTATIEMADGSMITFRLHPFDAPTNAARFVRLAKAGTFDGLTFHRVVPFFVVQGPSPNANEYAAPDAPFTRDELGLSNLRGTIGLSTRGRDTGDGQFYVNTVDNIRLDHDYTVMGTIVSGLEAFDRMQEGAKIRRIFVR